MKIWVSLETHSQGLVYVSVKHMRKLEDQELGWQPSLDWRTTEVIGPHWNRAFRLKVNKNAHTHSVVVKNNFIVENHY